MGSTLRLPNIGAAAFVLAAGLALATGAPTRANASRSDVSRVTEAARDSSAPIQLAPTEVSALRPSALERNDVQFRVRSTMASLHGESAWAPGAFVGRLDRDPGSFEANELDGIDLEYPVEGVERLFLAGGHVTIHDPADIAALGAHAGDAWSTSAGVEIRF